VSKSRDAVRGLNLTCAATNVASFPQQVLIAQERRRATVKQKAEAAAKKKASARGPKHIPGSRARSPLIQAGVDG
jgi:hypothetical protein